MKAVQEFTPEYLAQCQKMSTEEIVRFLDQFRQIYGRRADVATKSKLISLKVPQDLLEAFKSKAEQEGVRYQTQIKALMRAWVRSEKG